MIKLKKVPVKWFLEHVSNDTFRRLQADLPVAEGECLRAPQGIGGLGSYFMSIPCVCRGASEPHWHDFGGNAHVLPEFVEIPEAWAG